ncbi:MAG: HAMP domain-containing protein [Bacillota bacterium]|nr:HAMP domain-containing protein [Bacillota bacterium]
MKSRMLRKVLGGFLLVLLFFALMMGLIFFRLGRDSITAAARQMAESRARNIASSLTAVLYHDTFAYFAPAEKAQTNLREEQGTQLQRERAGNSKEEAQAADSRQKQRAWGQGQGQRFIAWMNELLTTNIRIVVRQETDELPLALDSILPAELTPAEQGIVDRVWNNETASLVTGRIGIGDASILTATPLFNAKGQITAALLLREDARDSSVLLAEAQRLFVISIGIAAFFVFVLALFLTRQLLRPLARIQEITRELSAGRYEVRTGIRQNDELGALAEDVDGLALRLAETRQQSLYLNQLREDFISSMSHELKTPVTVMKTSLEALQ